MADKVKKAHGHIIQADWNQTDPLQMDYIHNKPTNLAIKDDLVGQKTADGGEIFNDYTNNIAKNDAHAEGEHTDASGSASHAEGAYTTASGNHSHAEGNNTDASEEAAHAEGIETEASGMYSHAEGASTTASAFAAHSEGCSTTASGERSHAEGSGTTASGAYSHSEGNSTTASGEYAHAEGSGTTADGVASHTEGNQTYAAGLGAHAEGSNTYAYSYYSHAEGYSTNVDMAAEGAHAEGYCTTAYGKYAHVEGYSTSADADYQHVQGKYNVPGNYAHIVGNGTDSANCSNAHTLDWDGNAWFAGDVYVGSLSGTNKKLATEDTVDTKVATKTSVTVGGAHQEIFNADTKQNKIVSDATYARIPGFTNSGAITWYYRDQSLGNIGATGTGTTLATYRTSSETTNINDTNKRHLLTSTPTKDFHCANKKYVDSTFVNKAGDTITGDLTITGNLQIKGISETVDAVTYKVENNLIEFNPDKTYNNTWLTGIVVNKGIKDETDLGTYGIMYDPHADSVKLGFGTISENHTFAFNDNESAPIATREEYNKDWEDDAIFVFDKTTKKFKYSGKTLSGFKKEIQDEMKDYIANYIETYMSTVTEVDSENEDVTSLYTNGKTKEVTTEDGNLWLYVGGTNE